MLILGKRIKELRKEKGITQSELAKIIGISTSIIGMYETNARKPNYEILIKLAKYFEVSIDYLLGNDQNNSDIKIKEIREMKGYGLNELSRLSGVNASYISALERGEKQNPTITTLTKIANALEVTINELLYREKLISKNSKKNNDSIEDLIKSILYNPLIMEKCNYDIYKSTEEQMNEFADDLFKFIKIFGPKYLK